MLESDIARDDLYVDRYKVIIKIARSGSVIKLLELGVKGIELQLSATRVGVGFRSLREDLLCRCRIPECEDSSEALLMS